MKRLLSIVSMVSVVCVVNASAAKELVFTKASKSLSMPQFVDFMMKYGDDAVIDAPRICRALDLPGAENGVVPIKGDSTDPGEAGPDKNKAAQLVLAKSSHGPIPDSFVLAVDDLYPREHRTIGWSYKFDLSGRFVAALKIPGALDDKGEGVQGSGKIESLDVTSKKVQAQAQKELDFWRHYTAWELPRKKAAAEKAKKAK